ncbi:hypothetical protein TCAL_01997 [Tigriopus californicus]|uniref:Apple domain-containing protein n=1 Tax=Tigriopus californicus TaxID=6832 RepID=A0A553PR01_TIGCA|nr:hypothetical protein TCAL_01997 [Tigriopus californicus]|eukprot:TCALIF_01997-PA protein Name:"Protein of unknown function" AED:0.01 eAED:0.01 QI:0/0.75/0.8/1/0.75/0.8/5/63/521
MVDVKKQLVLFFCTLHVSWASSNSPGIQCFVPGECLDSQILDARPTNTSRECLTQCQSLTGCEWFTWYTDSTVCTSLSGCLSLTQDKCGSNCISGEQECPEIQCEVHGRCYGALEGIRKVGNVDECSSICGRRAECTWFSYSNQSSSCTMTNDCPVLDRSCSDCQASEKACAQGIEGKSKDLFEMFMWLLAKPEELPMSQYVYTDGHIVYSINSSDEKIMWLTAIPEVPNSFKIQVVSKCHEDLFVLLRYDFKGELDKDKIWALNLDKATLKWNDVAFPSPDLQLTLPCEFSRLKDGRIWVYCPKLPQTILFDGIHIVPSIEPLWVKSGHGLEHFGIGRVHENEFIVVGGLPYDLEKGISSQSISNRVYLIDFNKNESGALPNIDASLLTPLIWPMILDNELKVFITGGYKSKNDLEKETNINRLLFVLDWKSKTFSSITRSSDKYLKLSTLPVKYVFMSGDEPYICYSTETDAFMYNLQDIINVKDPKRRRHFKINQMELVKRPQVADVSDWFDKEDENA